MNFTMPKESYFAAANGFSGFRSYFNEIFNPNKFTRIYVLKGGPGTGKSSLMKKTCLHFQDAGLNCEAIFCSSDPSSLDGIIIKNKGKKIAIVDGTAPHETDAKIPGAVDEIINLGEAWNKHFLIENCEKIKKLNQEKRAHYKNAYESLRLAGKFQKLSNECINQAYKSNDTQFINDIIFDIQKINSGRNSETRLFSAFGKSGYIRLPLKDWGVKKKISIGGILGSEYIFMNNLLNAANMRGTSYIRYASPYSDDITEGLFFIENQTLVTTGNEFEEKLDTSLFLDELVLKSCKEKLNYYLKIFSDLLQHAKNGFFSASNVHFELEKIYSDAMDFNKVDLIQRKIIDELKTILY